MDQNWAPYFPSSNLLCSPVNPTLIKGQLYNRSRWWVSEYTCKNAPCSPTGNGQNGNATHMSTSWRTTKTDLCKDSCNEKPAIAKENVADVYGHENCKPYCCGGETTQAALCVLYDPIVCVKREVCERADVREGGHPISRGEDVYQSADSDPLCREK